VSFTSDRKFDSYFSFENQLQLINITSQKQSKAMSLQTSTHLTDEDWTCSSCEYEWHDLDTQCPCWMNEPRTRYDDSFIPLDSEALKNKTRSSSKESIQELDKLPYKTLGREQVMKIVFMQLGDKVGIPKDVVILIWQIMKQSEITDTNAVREYHLCSIYRISNHITSVSFERNHVLHPINRGIEWSIKWASTYNSHKITGLREEIHSHIQIIGEEDYLIEQVGDLGSEEPIWEPASRRTKIHYVNSYNDGVDNDYVTHEYDLWKSQDRSYHLQVSWHSTPYQVF